MSSFFFFFVLLSKYSVNYISSYICSTKALSIVFINPIGSPYAVVLDTPLDYSLDDCIEYIQEDELVEVTPSSIRMCKNLKMAKKTR